MKHKLYVKVARLSWWLFHVRTYFHLHREKEGSLTKFGSFKEDERENEWIDLKIHYTKYPFN